MKLKFKKLHVNAKLPIRSTKYSGGWDVVCTRIERPNDDFAICYLGWSVEIPTGYRLMLQPRSSFTATQWVQQNSPGLGDPDYRGEYQFRFRAMPIGITGMLDIGDRGQGPFVGAWELENNLSLTYPNFPYEEGDRIGQIYLEPIIPIENEWEEELSNTERGEGGFGSTGKN